MNIVSGWVLIQLCESSLPGTAVDVLGSTPPNPTVEAFVVTAPNIIPPAVKICTRTSRRIMMSIYDDSELTMLKNIHKQTCALSQIYNLCTLLIMYSIKCKLQQLMLIIGVDRKL